MIAFLVLALLQTDPKGTPEQLQHYRLATQVGRPEAVDASQEAAGLSSSRFETRYAALVMKIHRTMAAGGGFEPLYKSIKGLSAEGGPPGAAAHFQALAESLRKAVACTACEEGKVSCKPCQGKGKGDLPCDACNGEGRVKTKGAVGKSDVTTKCRNCDGQKIFKGVRCTGCAGAGHAKCGTCKGTPWPENRCSVKDCLSGRVPCLPCKGAGKLKVDCPDCEGGRVRPAGAVGGTNLTVKCRKCEKKGEQGDGTIEEDCKACEKTGRRTCKACGGTFAAKDGRVASLAVTSVLRLEKCRACDGKGWPKPGVADPCPGCLGLGSEVAPAADPGKRLR